jgi:hypothetical protein
LGGPVKRLESGGRVAVRVAAAAAIAVAGGTAAAAETGNLPSAVQQRAHHLFSTLGVPGRSAGGPSSATHPGRASPTPTAGAGTTGPGASTATGFSLCQTWNAAQQDPHGKAMPAESRRTLAALAGGEPDIAAYCARLLAQPATPTTTTPATTAPSTTTPSTVATPSRPGNNGRGTGHGHPTPSPHH